MMPLLPLAEPSIAEQLNTPLPLLELNMTPNLTQALVPSSSTGADDPGSQMPVSIIGASGMEVVAE
jgi:hypothetical protein